MSKASEVLQAAFEADPQAIHALMVNRVPCNDKLADDPYVFVDESLVAKKSYCVGALGLINAVLAANDLQLVAIQFSDDKDEENRRSILGFCDYSQPQVKYPAKSEETKPVRHKSIAVWPDTINVASCKNESVDLHDSKEAAEAVCHLLQKHGFGGDGKVFPLSTRVEPAE